MVQRHTLLNNMLRTDSIHCGKQQLWNHHSRRLRRNKVEKLKLLFAVNAPLVCPRKWKFLFFF